MLGVRPAPDAVSAERGLQPGDVRGSAQGGIDLHGAGECGPCLATVASVDEPRGRCLQRFRLQQWPGGVVIPVRRSEKPGGIAVQQPTAIERVRLPMRDLRLAGEGGGVARDGPCGAHVAGLAGETDGVGQQVLDLLEFFCIAVERIRQRGQRLR